MSHPNNDLWLEARYEEFRGYLEVHAFNEAEQVIFSVKEHFPDEAQFMIDELNEVSPFKSPYV